MTVFLRLASGGLGSQEEEASPGGVVEGPIGRALDDYLTRCVPFGFSGAVLAAKKGVVVLSKGYGIADRASGAPCTSSTIFDLGPLAQSLTASAVLVLEQKKLLETDDTLEAFLPEVPPDKRKIRLHHLLTHTSGLPPEIPGVGPKLATREELIQTALRVPLLDSPGADFVPSDAGYALLAAIVELVTKHPFEEALRELVLAPAGLTSTGFRQDGALAAARAARAFLTPEEPLPEGAKPMCLPKRVELDDERELATEGWYSWGLRGAGGVLGTVEDLWRLEQALRGGELLDKASRKKLVTPALDSFACGGYVKKGLRKTTSVERSGSTASGFGASGARFPDEDSFVVVLSNAPAALPAIEADLRALLFEGEVELPPATLALADEALTAFAGEYGHDGGARWRVAVHGGALLLEARSPDALALHSGKLTGDQKLAVKLGERIAAELTKSRFDQMHELDRGSGAFQGVESWWRELVQPHGTLRSATALGLVQDALGLDHVVVRLEFERGEELLDLRWSYGYLVGCDTGPPYASRLRLVPDGERSFAAYDLVRRKRMAGARFGPGGELELELSGGKIVARRK